jgi:hypothetical protein
MDAVAVKGERPAQFGTSLKARADYIAHYLHTGQQPAMGNQATLGGVNISKAGAGSTGDSEPITAPACKTRSKLVVSNSTVNAKCGHTCV